MESRRGERVCAVLVHFDPDGEVAPHVRRTVAALRGSAERLVIVSTAPLTTPSREWLQSRGELIERANTGHDFGSYLAGIDRLGSDVDRLILVNDSAVFPLIDLNRILATMRRRGADVWGITPGYGFSRHIQSYAIVFEPTALQSDAFSGFWSRVRADRTREDVILDYEVGLTRAMRERGLRIDTYFRPRRRELWRGAARAHMPELTGAWSRRRWRTVAGWLRRLPARSLRPEWNPAVALADVALARPDRLPVVKVSALRDDAYHLGSAELLGALEARQLEHFTGVRAYLERTDPAYGNRWSEAASPVARWARYRTGRRARSAREASVRSGHARG